MSPKFKGIYTAIITPFLEDGSIDWQSFEQLVHKQIEANIHGLVIGGTTGESPTLSVQEKLSLIRKAKAMSANELKIMAGSGGQSTSQSIELSKLSMDAGADALLVVTPPYNKPNRQGLLKHFESIATSVNIPVCLYHVPGRTSHSLSASEIAEICQIDHVTCVKEASGNLELFSEAIHKTDPSIDFLSGDDPTFLASLSIQASGCISVTSNLFPKAMTSLYTAFTSGNIKLAQNIHYALFPIFKLLFIETNPVPLKFCMSHKGYCKNVLRLPLAPVSSQSAEQLTQCMIEVEDKLVTSIEN